MMNLPTIHGSSGGGGGGGRTPIEDQNDLRSKATTRFVGIMSEGEIGGLVNGAKSIYFDSTPLQAEDGTFNFEGVTWWERKGAPDQEHIPGFPSVENEYSVNADVTHAAPVVRTITNTETDAVRVRVQLNGLMKQNAQGDLIRNKIEVAVDVRSSGGDFVTRLTDTIEGKTTSAYERAYRVELTGSAPWDIRVRRVSEDTDSAKIIDKLKWAAYTEIIDAKLIYPDTAVMGMAIDAEAFGNAVPQVAFEIYGIKVEVPSNYDPLTRAYSGLWDGTFKVAWTDNPAWIIRDVLVFARYGLGLDSVDKWFLYEISKYCDELVPDGYGGMEPRFRLNCVLQTREDAYHAINALIATCRGMCYWSSSSVAFSQDSPADPTHYASPSNVENGEFKYQGSSIRSRHTAAMVTWNDPSDGYKPAVEMYEDAEAIARYGYNPTDVAELGCIYRGQAHRKGKWLVETEQTETETVQFTGGLEFSDAAPGNLVAVTDPDVAGCRMGGRIKAATTAQVIIDAPIAIEAGEDYVLTVVLPDKTTADTSIINAPGTTDTLNLFPALPVQPQKGAGWAVSATNLAPRLFRILSNRETDIHKFEITALLRDPTKFERVEQNLRLDPVPVSTIPTGPITKPTAPSVDEYLYTFGEGVAPGVMLSWSTAADERVVRYEAQIQRPDQGWDISKQGASMSASFSNTPAGTYAFRVRSLTSTGRASLWLTIENINLTGLNQPPNDVDNLVMAMKNGQGVIAWDNLVMAMKNGQGVIAWDKVVDWRSVHYEIRKGTMWHTAMPLGTTAELSYPVGSNGTYMVKAMAGTTYSDNPALVVVDGSGRLVTNVLADYDEGSLGWLGPVGGTAIKDAGNITLSDPSAPGWYTIPEAHIVALDTPALCNVDIDFTLYGSGIYDDIYAAADVYAITDIYGGYGQYVHGVPFINTWNNGAWDGWRKFVPGSYYAERFYIYIHLSSDRADVAPILSDFSFSVDVPDRTERKDNLAVSVAGLEIVFDTQFNVVPSVVCQVIAAVGGETVELTGLSKTGCLVKVKDDSGAYAARNINYIAQGY
ncbi:phage tail protein [uncultured Pseudodesulfovibrio sp.]|uniref:host specificity protein J n=1 Tax=uncultured Pseudodesulfovibrio sp. TaxID=2035858 RepID=UPI0029C8EC0E|nr:phage tail protein [uncultured Pseudodesulfovibrio sp.]